jgi:HK97 family phage portal protein
MKLLRRLLTRASPAGDGDTYDMYWDRLAYSAPVAGVNVNPKTAEGLSAVYACVSSIAETVGSLPLIVYERTEQGRRRAPEHPLYKLLHDQPNDYQTALEFRELLQRHLLLSGNGYAEIIWRADGSPEALLPLHPERVTILRSHSGGLLYEVANHDGSRRRLLPGEVLHLRYHSDEGVLGRSPVTVARETVGLALAERAHGAAMFANGTRLSGIIQSPAPLTKEQADSLRTQWNTAHAGVT